MTNHIKEIIYNMAIEEHNIWILHNQELMPLYEPDQERLDKIAITRENFKQVTKDLDKPYEETKEEYKKNTNNIDKRNVQHSNRIKTR